MQKGPLVTLAVVFAALLIILSFAMVLLPDFVETLSIGAGIIALMAIIILIIMLVKTRKV